MAAVPPAPNCKMFSATGSSEREGTADVDTSVPGDPRLGHGRRGPRDASRVHTPHQEPCDTALHRVPPSLVQFSTRPPRLPAHTGPGSHKALVSSSQPAPMTCPLTLRCWAPGDLEPLPSTGERIRTALRIPRLHFSANEVQCVI